MDSPALVLFGEAEKGRINTLYYCPTLEQLFNYFGSPPSNTDGLYYAIQVILYGKPLLYFRVHEEGVSTEDYLLGLHLLREQNGEIPHVGALFLPGVGSQAIIDEGLLVCREHHGLLLMKESDLYDYLTDYAFLTRGQKST
jgi:hypothetical protein